MKSMFYQINLYKQFKSYFIMGVADDTSLDEVHENHYDLRLEIIAGGSKLVVYDRNKETEVMTSLAVVDIPGGSGWLPSGGNLGSPRCTVNSRNVESALDDALSHLGERLGQQFTYDAHAIRTDLGAIGFSYRGSHPKPAKK
jgi:hypothetical protein